MNSRRRRGAKATGVYDSLLELRQRLQNYPTYIGGMSIQHVQLATQREMFLLRYSQDPTTCVRKDKKSRVDSTCDDDAYRYTRADRGK